MSDPEKAKDGRSKKADSNRQGWQRRIRSFHDDIGRLLSEMRRKRRKTQQDFLVPQRTIRRIEQGTVQRSTSLEYLCEMKPCSREAAQWIRAVLALLSPGCMRCDPDCRMCDKSVSELAGQLRRDTGLEEVAMERAMLRGIIEHNPYAIAIFDEDGRFARANQAYYDLFKMPPPKPITLFDSPPLREAGVQEEFMKLKKGETIVLPPIWHNSRAVGSEWPDNPICIGTAAFPLQDNSGRIRNYVAMSKDVTQQVLAEKRLRDTLSFKNELIALLSKKIGTPLGRIMSAAHRLALDESSGLPKERKEDLTLVLKNVERMTKTIDDLIDIMDGEPRGPSN